VSHFRREVNGEGKSLESDGVPLKLPACNWTRPEQHDIDSISGRAGKNASNNTFACQDFLG
jgi:hypothetical protein